MNKHIFNKTVYVNETDIGGVTYYGNYLTFFGQARSEWFKAIGYSETRMLSDFDIGFMIKNVAIDYNAPSTLDDNLTIESSVESISKSSFVVIQKIFKGEKLITKGTAVLVCVNKVSLRPKAIPTEIANVLESYIQAA